MDSITGDEIMKKVPEDQPRFIFFNYTHTFENTDMNSVCMYFQLCVTLLVFIYFCPIKSKIKQRMVYSSAKQAVLTAAKDAGVNIDKSVRISSQQLSNFLIDGSIRNWRHYNQIFAWYTQSVSRKITHSLDYIHPPKVEEVKFSKPKRPGKGRARIAK